MIDTQAEKEILLEKSYLFAVRMIKFAQYLQSQKKEFIMSKQVLCCGTMLAIHIQRTKFIYIPKKLIDELNAALAKNNRIQYWMRILAETSYINISQFDIIINECNELSILISNIKDKIK